MSIPLPLQPSSLKQSQALTLSVHSKHSRPALQRDVTNCIIPMLYSDCLYCLALLNEITHKSVIRSIIFITLPSRASTDSRHNFAFTEQHSQLRLHRRAFTTPPSQDGIRNSAFTGRRSQLRLHRTAFTTPPSQDSIHNSAFTGQHSHCLLYTSPSPRDFCRSRMPSSA